VGRREERCLFADRGFNFTYVALAFLDNDWIVGRDRRWDYGEDRYRLLGAVGGRVFVVIYTRRGSTIRIIPHARPTAGRYANVIRRTPDRGRLAWNNRSHSLCSLAHSSPWKTADGIRRLLATRSRPSPR